MTVIEWLDSELEPEQLDKDGNITRPTVFVKDRLAELVHKNGGSSQVTGWGITQLGGIYGSIGLTRDEALGLIHLNGILQGFLFSLPDEATARAAFDEVMHVIKSIWQKLGEEDLREEL